jgi:ubiquinone/menaquinone biosynthesis C-methylase UbiE
MPKTNKELAYLHELFVATDWTERFAELVDEHVKMPKDGKVLYLAAGTGRHAITLQERSSDSLEFLCIEENEESLELARAKATVLGDAVKFQQGKVDHIPSPDNSFDVVIGDGSLVQAVRIPEVLREMVRVAAPNAVVALSLPTFSSFGEFFSIYWEALHNSGLTNHESVVEGLISKLPSVSAVEQMAEEVGLSDVKSWTRIEELDYDSGEVFLSSPLVSDFLMPGWLRSLPEGSYEELANEIGRLINEERHEAEFALSFKATLMVGKKALVQ